MAKKPYKFRQARKDAKAAAKKAFPGKVKARRVDPKIKMSAEDRLALKEAQDTAKKELGNKAYLSRAEYEAEQRAAREAFREKMREEFGSYGNRKAEPAATKKAQPKKPAKKAIAKKAVTPKPAAKKAAIKPSKTFGQISKSVAKATELSELGKRRLDQMKKAGISEADAKKVLATNKPSYEKKMTRAERSAANKARWKSMTPAERKNWSANKPGAKGEVLIQGKKYDVASGAADKKMNELAKTQTPKNPSAVKRPTLTQLKRQEAKGLEEAKARVEARKAGAGAKPRGMKSGAKPGQQPTAKAKPSVKPAGGGIADKAKKLGKTRKFIKGTAAAAALTALGAETVSLVKGSTQKDYNEIVRLRKKLSAIKGEKEKGNTFSERLGASAGSLIALTTGVGKTRRERIDELNKLISKEQAKQAKAQAKDVSKWRYGPGGESLVPGTAAYKAGSKTRPTQAQVAANFQAAQAAKAGGAKGGATGGTGTGGAGSTIKVTPGSSYTVKKGDTLSAIAKSAGVSLADLRAANKKFKTNPKYKQGSMIFSGTTVKIPKKK